MSQSEVECCLFGPLKEQNMLYWSLKHDVQ